MQCIKAAGVNFSYTYDQFFNYKSRKQQATNSGYRDWSNQIHNTHYQNISIQTYPIFIQITEWESL